MQHLAGWVKSASKAGALEDCSLIVATYNRKREISGLVQLLTVLSDVPREVIVVDGAPSCELDEHLLPWAEQNNLPFDLVYIRSPAGLTRQRNVGIDASTREFVFFLDDDSVPKPGYFRAIRAVFLNDVAREIGAVRGSFNNAENDKLTWLWRARFALRLVPRGAPGTYFSCGTSATWNGVQPFTGIKFVDVLTGCAMTFRRAVLRQHRFSLFFSGYSQGEDLEMSRRIAKDWKLAVCGEALVDHEGAEGGRPGGFRRARMAVRNHFFIWKRHVPVISLVDRIRFWLNVVLIVVHHLAGFVLHRFNPQYLAYAAGTVRGAVECLFVPPAYEEPPARREYDFNLRPVGCEVASAPAENSRP